MELVMLTWKNELLQLSVQVCNFAVAMYLDYVHV